MGDWDVVSQTPVAPGRVPVGQQTPDGALRVEMVPSGSPQAGQRQGSRPSHADVVEFWQSKGAPPHVAEGIADGLAFESGLNPTITNPTSGAYGIYQALGPRKKNLLSQMGGATDWRVQLEQAYKDVTGADPQATAGWNAILGAKDKRTAALLWDKYFERSGTGGAGGMGWSVVGSGDWKVSGSALDYERKAGGSVRYMDPYDYLALVAPVENDERQNRKGRSLAKSLALGEDIQAIPTIDAKMGEDGTVKVEDYDGRHRAMEAIKAGVELIPVGIRGLTGEAKQIEGMTGYSRPFDFKEVPKDAFRAEQAAVLSGQKGSPPPATVQDRVAARTPPQDAPPSVGQRFATGMADIGIGALQMGAHAPVMPDAMPFMPEQMARANDPETVARPVDELVRAREFGIERERAARGETGTDWWRVGGNVAATLPLAFLGPAGGGMRGAIGANALMGLAGGALAPVTEGDYNAGKLGEMGISSVLGAGLGAGGYAAGKMISPLANKLLQWTGLKEPPANALAAMQRENQARSLVAEKFAADAAGGGPGPMDVAERLAGARTEGQPLTLMDIGGDNVRGLAGTAYRVPGEGRAAMQSFYKSRDVSAPERVRRLLDRYVSSGSAKETAERLIAERSAKAKPLWEKAREGGSIAPLEKQLETVFNEASAEEAKLSQTLAKVNNEMTQAAARQSVAGNVYSGSASNRLAQFVKDKVGDINKRLESARENKALALDVLRRAQADRTANAKGAVWSPSLQRLLDFSEIQRGLRRGYAIEKRNAAEQIAEGKRFDPTEYAVLGETKEGEPIVGAVPNMSLLMVAKEGLDATIEDLKNPLTGRPTKEGLSYIRLRDAFLKEVDRLNPDYKPARDAWSGDTASIAALNDGRRAFENGRFTREELAEHVAKLSENDKEFFRLGMAEKLRDSLYRTADAGDESKRVINNEDTRMRVRAVLGDDARAEKLIEGIAREREMFEAPREVMRGSQTAGRTEEDRAARVGNALKAGFDVVRAGAHLAHGNSVSGTHALVSLASRLGRKRPLDPELYANVARLLSDPNIAINGGLKPMLPPVQLPAPRNALAQFLGGTAQFVSPGAGAAASSP